ncbi:TPA: hypothetical protein ACWYFJ_003656, partial [Morganella morganii]
CKVVSGSLFLTAFNRESISVIAEHPNPGEIKALLTTRPQNLIRFIPFDGHFITGLGSGSPLISRT